MFWRTKLNNLFGVLTWMSPNALFLEVTPNTWRLNLIKRKCDDWHLAQMLELSKDNSYYPAISGRPKRRCLNVTLKQPVFFKLFKFRDCTQFTNYFPVFQKKVISCRTVVKQVNSRKYTAPLIYLPRQEKINILNYSWSKHRHSRL